MTSSAGQPMNVGVNSTSRARLDATSLNDAEVDERDDRELGVGDLREGVPDASGDTGRTEQVSN